MTAFRPAVLVALEAHGLTPGADETAGALKERLNDVYLVEVRRLRERQRNGEIPIREYAAHAEALKQRFALLGLPLEQWVVP